ncbi:hypothetical protein [Streptococcus suis]|uniref:hypothetical protein n=1 Tax=Streptococcus suis TaxID=1307 RepID=UPI001ABD9E05|nr:hypothetical protein [Streptococcus suis]
MKKLNLVLAAVVCLLQAGCQIQQVTVENVAEGTATTEKIILLGRGVIDRLVVMAV